MKKFINNQDDLTRELLEGMVMAYSQKVKLVSDKIVCRVTPKDKSKVAVMSLGGSGHEPAIQGWVGKGLLDASVVGDIFAAPGAPKLVEALDMLNRDAGILIVTLNHAGDVMSAEMAKKMASMKGIKHNEVITSEEIRPGEQEGRGLGGCLFVYKVAGAAAERGDNLDEVTRIAQKMNANMATIAVLSELASHPSNGMTLGTMGEDEMEIYAGQHGEGGGVRMKMKSAKETAEILSEQIEKKLNLKSGDEILLVVNGSGKTTLMEMLVSFRDAAKYFEAKGIKVVRGCADELLTVQEAAGYQLMAAKMDKELLELWDAPCDSPYFTMVKE